LTSVTYIYRLHEAIKFQDYERFSKKFLKLSKKKVKNKNNKSVRVVIETQINFV